MRVSVIIPAHNEANHIKRAIDSCLSQDKVTEIIIIDDGSTDETFAYTNSYDDSRLLVLQHQDKSNHGRSASRNLGIQNARNEWIAFCDADDYFLPRRFDHLPLDISNVDGFYDPIGTHYSSDGIQEKYPDVSTSIPNNIEPANLANYLISNQVNHISILGLVVRKQALLDVGLFDESLHIGEDTDLIWRLAMNATLSSGRSKSPVAHRWVDGSNTYLNPEVIHDKYFFYHKWYNLLPHLNISNDAKKRIKNSYRYYKVESKFGKFPGTVKGIIRRLN